MKENGTLLEGSMLKEWLLERARLYGKCADNISARLDNISIKLDYPDRGWIDTHIKKPNCLRFPGAMTPLRT